MSRGCYVRCIRLLAALALALAVGGCRKEPTGPDLSNPKAAAITFARAMEDGDIETAKNCTIAGGLEVDLVEAMVKATHALRKLGAACKEKFGDAATTTMMRQTGAI